MKKLIIHNECDISDIDALKIITRMIENGNHRIMHTGNVVVTIPQRHVKDGTVSYYINSIERERY